MTLDRLLELLPYLWFAVLSVIAIMVTIYDKLAAKLLPNRRTPEKALFLLAALGGSVAMYAAMQLIRHKTRHKRFMLGLPAIIVAQVALLVVLVLLS